MDKYSSLYASLSTVLRVGLVLAITVTLIGGGLLLWQRGMEKVDYKIFKGAPKSLIEMDAIVSNAVKGEALAIIQLGVLLMIATPIARVASCVIGFTYQRDLLYALLSSIVLVTLLYSFFARLK